MSEVQLSVDMIKDIYTSMARMEAKLDAMGDVRDVAIEAMQSTKSAHNRIDGVEESMNQRLDKIDKIIFWAGTTIIGGLVVGSLGVLFAFASK